METYSPLSNHKAGTILQKLFSTLFFGLNRALLVEPLRKYNSSSKSRLHLLAAILLLAGGLVSTNLVAQSGFYETYVVLDDGSGNQFYDAGATTPAPNFQGANLGTFSCSSSVYIGGQGKTFKCSPCDVTATRVFWRVWSGSPSGSFIPVEFGFASNDGTGCDGNDQTWQEIGLGKPDVLSGLTPGNYSLEVYFEGNSTGGCTSPFYDSNGGSNYIASFNVAGPVVNTTTLSSFCSIQEAIDDPATLDGHTITVEAGTYDEVLLINKQISLLGPNSAISAVNGTRASEARLLQRININEVTNVTVSGFEFFEVPTTTTWTIYIQGNSNNFTFKNNRFIDITTDAIRSGITSSTGNITVSGNLIEGMNNPLATGFLLGGIYGTSAITDNKIDLAYAGNPMGYSGIQVPSADGLTISGNEISNSTNQGLQLAGSCGSVLIENNNIFNTNASGGGDKGAIRIYGADFAGQITIRNNFLSSSYNGVAVKDGQDISGKDILIQNNDLSGNSNNAIYNGASAGTLNAPCNWYGTAVPADIPAEISGQVNYVPYLNNGTDDAPTTPGFQPVPGSCNGCIVGGLVTNTNTGNTYCSIQAAIDDPATINGHTITVAAGTYNESVIVNKALTILGPNAGISPISGIRVPEAILVNTPTGRTFSIYSGNTDITIEGFMFDGGSPMHDGNDTSNPATSDVAFSNNLVVNSNAIYAGNNTSWADLVINDNKFQDVNATATSSAMQLINTNSITITDNAFININYAAILIDATPTVHISGNTIDGTGAQAIQLAGSIGNATVKYNNINDANGAQSADKGAVRIYGSGFTGTVLISNNTITGGHNGIAVKSGEDITGKNITVSRNSITNLTSGVAIYNGGTGTLNAPCNWYGTAVAADIPAKITGSVNYVPYLNDGTDDAPTTPGFQPVPGSCAGCISGGLVTNDNTGNTYCSIQAAIDDAATTDGDVILVAAGVYAEDIVVTKELEIRGPNYNISPNSGSRVAEAIIHPLTSSPFGEIIKIQSSNVIINGFTIDGDNPNTTSTYLGVNGADLDAAEAITVYVDNVNNLNVSNNIIENLAYFGVTIYGGSFSSPTTSGHIVNENLFQNLGTYDAASGIDFWGGGVLIYNDQYTAITNNTMTGVRIGIQTGNFHDANTGTTAFQVIDGNTISTRKLGVFYNLHTGPGVSPYTVSNNTISAEANANETEWVGVLAASLSDAVGVISGNNINGSGLSITSQGIEVWNVNQNSPVTIENDIVSNVDIGIFLNNYEGYNSDANNGAHANIDGADITASVGVRLLDSPSSSTNAQIVATITGSSINANEGVILEETVTGTVSATINGNSITGWASTAINSNVDNTIDATCNWYGTSDPTLIDNAITGDVTAVPFLKPDAAGTTYSWSGTDTYSCSGGAPIANLTQGTFYMTVQAAVDAASGDDVLEIQSADFSEPAQIVIDKDLTLQGLGKSSTILRPSVNTTTSGDGRGFILVSSGVDFSLQNLTINGSGKLVWQAVRHQGSGSIDEVGFTEIKYNPSSNYQGTAIAAFGTGNVDISNSDFDNIGRIGVLYFGTGITGSNFTGNTYTGKGAGDWLDYALDISAGAIVNASNNAISDNRGVASSDGSTSAGILVSTYFAPGTDATITNNDLHNNTSAVSVGFNASDASAAVVNGNRIVNNDFAVVSTASSVDATCNWYDTTDAIAVGQKMSGDVTYLPLLLSGAENNPSATGFDPAGPCASPYASFVLTPSTTSTAECDEFTILVSVETTGPLNVAEGRFNFDPAQLEVVSINAPGGGTLPSGILETPVQPPVFDNVNGTFAYGATTTGTAPSSDFDFYEVTFKALGTSGTTDITPILAPDFPKSLIAYTDNSGPIAISYSVLSGVDTATVTLSPDVTPPTAVCQDITVNLNAAGIAIITANSINNGSSDNCGPVSLSASQTVFSCGDVSAAPVTNEIWINEFHYDNSGTDQGEFIEVVSNFDASGYKVELYNGGSNVYATLLLANATLSTSGGWNYYNIDATGIQNGPNDGFALIDDSTIPNVIEFLSYEGEITALVGTASGMTSTDVDDEESGSTLAGESIQLTGTGSQASDFTWTGPSADSPGAVNAGQTLQSPAGAGTPVTLTVTDSNGNSSTCIATVTVLDNIAPTAVCKNATVALDASGNASIVVADINNGSSDACGIATLELDKTAFTCADLGANTVTLTVTDNNGNISTCTSTVTVTDGIDPVAACKNITVQLDGSGNVTITGGDIDNGSSDNCEVASLTASPNSFTCADIGTNTVTLTVTDSEGNTDTCTADVTVEDNVAPVAICQDIDVYVDANGDASIVAADIDDGSNDNCSPVTLSASPLNFNCSNVLGAAPNAAWINEFHYDNNGGDVGEFVEIAANYDIQGFQVILYNGNGGAAYDTKSIGAPISTTDGFNFYTITPSNGIQNGAPDGIALVSNGGVVIEFISYEGTSFMATDGPANGQTSVNIGVSEIGTEAVGNSLQRTGSGAQGSDFTWSGPSSESPGAINTLQTIDLSNSVLVPSSTPVVLTATDAYGNSSSCNAAVTVLDTVAPAAVCQNITVQLDGSGIVSIVAADVDGGSTDNCTASPTLSVSQTDFDCSHIGANTVTLSVTDASGNASTCVATVTVEDSVMPTISCPGAITVELSTAPDPFVTGVATGTDNCSFEITYSDNRSGLTGCNGTGTLLRTFTITDAGGNSASCAQTITIEDTEAPEAITCPSPITVSNDAGLCSAVVNFTGPETTTDNKYTESFENPNFEAGNAATASHQGWNNYGSNIARVTSGTDGISSTDGSAHMVIDTTNSAGFTGAFSRLGGYSTEFGNGYTVQADVYMDLTDAGVANSTYGWDLAVASSKQDGGHLRDFIFHTASYTPGSILVAGSNNTNFTTRGDLATINGGNNYAITTSGWYTYEWIFRDNGSDQLAVDLNLKDASGTILFTETRSAPADVISTLVGGNRYMWFTFLDVEKLAVDNIKVLRNVIAGCTAESGDTFNVGTTNVNCTAADACGNEATCNFDVTVNDDELPNAVCQDLTVQLDANGNASITAGQINNVSTDNCGIASFSVSPSSFTCSNVGSNTVTLTVTDVNGNTSTCTATVTVVDDTAPTATCQDATVQLDSNGSGTLLASALDNGSIDNCSVSSIGILGCPGDLAYDQNVTPELINGDGIANGAFTIDTGSNVELGLRAKVRFPSPQNTFNSNGDGSYSHLTGSFGGDGMQSGWNFDWSINTDQAGNTGQKLADLTYQLGIDFDPSDGVDFVVFDPINAPYFDHAIGDNTTGNGDGVTATDATEYASFIAANNVAQNSWRNNFFGSFDGNVDGRYEVYLKAFDNLGNEVAATAISVIVGSGTGNVYAGCLMPLDSKAFDCSQVGANTETLVVIDANGNSTTCTSTVTVEDNVAPTAICRDITVQLDGSGAASIVAGDIDNGSNDACGIASLSITPSSFSCADVGPNTVTLTVTDVNGNVSICTSIVTVEDNTAPTASCQNATVQLDANGAATLSADDIDNGSSDNCGPVSLGVLGCPEDLSYNQNVTSDVIFGSGNANGAFTVATGSDVELGLRAKVRYPSPANTFNSNGDGSYNHAAGSFGSGGIQSGWNFEWSINSNVSGSGQNLDQLTYELGLDFDPSDGVDFQVFDPINQPYADHAIGDNSTGNGGGAVATDATDYATFIAANNLAQNSWRHNFFGAFDGNVDGRYEVYLKAFDNLGNEVAATAISVIVGSGTGNVYAGCLMPLDSKAFDCSQVGANTETLVVIDANGNSTTCTSTVTVEDNVAPTAICQDITVQLDGSGAASIVAGDIDNGSNDACGTVTLAADILTFDCSNVGANTVTLTVTDVNGNTSTCTATVTVVDDTAPTATCQDATVQLDSNGSGTLLASALDNGSIDNCSVSSIGILGCPGDLAYDQNVTPELINGDGIANGAFTIDTGSNVELGLRAKVRFPSPQNTFNSNGDGSYSHLTGSFGGDGMQSGWNFDWSINTDQAGNTGQKLADLTYQLGIDFDPSDGVDFVVFDPINAPYFDHAIGDNTTGNGDGVTATDATEYASFIAANNVAQNSWRNNFFGSFDGNVDGRYEVYLKAFDNLGNEVAATAISVIVGSGTGNVYAGCLMPLDSKAFDCSQVGANTETLVVIDANGNSTTCTSTVTVEDNVAPTAICQDITVQLDGSGAASIVAGDIDNGSNDACGTVTLAADILTFDCSNVGSNTVTLTVTDVNGNTSTCTATVTVVDDTAPTATCQDATVQLDSNGSGTLLASALDNGSIDNCSVSSIGILGCPGDLAYDQNVTPELINGDGIANGAFTIDTGSNVELGLRAKVRFPSPQNTFNSNGDGSYSHLTGSFGGDGMQSGWNFDWSINTDQAGNTGQKLADLTYQLGIDFDPSDGVDFVVFDPINAPYFDHAIGDNTTGNGDGVTATDATEYASFIAANNVAQNSWRNNFFGSFDGTVDGRYEVYLKAFNSNGVVVAQTAITVIAGNGSGNAYAGCLMPLDSINYDCANVGSNTETLVVIDANGNSTTCTSTVTVEDNVAPTAICQDITVQLDGSGAASIVAGDIDNGSNDACGTVTLAADILTFDCNNVGPNTVTLTVTDVNGNTSTCTATVTVEDNIDPVITCASDDSRFVNQTNNTYEVQGTEFDAAATDNCSVATISHNAASISGAIAGPDNVSLDGWQLPVGVNTVTFTATDTNGNTATCDVAITVEENTLSGTVAINPACAPIDMRILVFDAGTPNLVGSFITTIDANGDFSVALTGVVPGNYDVFFKAERYLQQGYLNQSISNSNFYALSGLRPGDISGGPDQFNDNLINSLDLSFMISHYNTISGGPNFDARCDLNCDGQVDGLDLSLLIFFYLQQGDNPTN